MTNHIRTAGSVQDFEQNWTNALATEARLAYPRWETANQWDIFEQVKIEQIKPLLAAYPPAQTRVLEYGCGPAGVSVWLANQGYNVTALDISLNGIALAQQNSRQNGQPGKQAPRFLVANALQMPFADSTFDIVVSNGLLEHFDHANLQILLPEVIRILKPGGLFLADIVHGKFSARTAGKLLNYTVRVVTEVVKGNLGKIPGLWQFYFDDLYENDLDYHDWQQFLKQLQLSDVTIQVSRPFPPLGMPVSWEKYYVNILKGLLPLWHFMDNHQNWLTRRWGWLYLAWGTKPATRPSKLAGEKVWRQS